MKKKFIAALTALAITLTAFTGITMPVGAEDVPSPSIEMWIDGQKYDPASGEIPECSPNAKFTAELNWKDIPAGTKEITYFLGTDIISSENNGGPVPGPDQNTVGNWWVDDKGYLHIKFNDAFENLLEKNCGVTFEGNIPLDPNEDVDRGNKELEFGKETVTVKPDFGESNVSADKASGSNEKGKSNIYVDEATGQFMLRQSITVTVSGNFAEGIELDDVIQESGITLPRPFGKDNVTVEYEPYLGDPSQNKLPNPIPNKEVEENYTVDSTDDSSFHVTLPGVFAPGDKVTLTYDVVITDEEMKEILQSDINYLTDINKVTAEYTDKDSGEHKEKEPTSSSLYNISKPSLEKSGQLDPETNTIEWTITFKPGLLKDIPGSTMSDEELLKYLIDNFGVGGFSDTLGDGLEILSTDPPVADMENISIEDFAPNNDWEHSFSIKVITKITDDDRNTFSNTASLNVLGDVTLDAESTIGIDYDVEKSFDSETEDDAMKWNITVDVPKGDFENLTITERPSADTNLKPGYEHKLLPESITVGGTKLSELIKDAEGGITLVDNKITITHDYAEKMRWPGTELTITVETEAVKDNSREGSLEPNFSYKNEVDYVVTYDDETTGTSHASAEHKSDTKELYKKDGTVVYDSSTPTSTVQWWVDITSEMLVGYNDNFSGLLYSDEELIIDLTDTLPDNMVYVPDSAYATVREMVTSYDGNLKKVGSDPSFYSVLTDGILTVIDNGDGTLSIKYDLTNDKKAAAKAQFDKLGSDGTLGWALQNGHLRICYITEIADTDKFIEQTPIGQYATESAEVTFTNTMEGKVNGEYGGKSIKEVSIARQALLTKDHGYSETLPSYDEYPYNDIGPINDPEKSEGVTDWRTGPFGTLNVPYKIDVNPQKLSLGEGGTIILEDKMGSSLQLIQESVKIKDCDTGEFLDRSEYTVTVEYPHFGEKDQRSRIYIEMPDGRHFKVTYYASIAEPPTSIEEGSNGNVKFNFDTLKDTSNEVSFKLRSDWEHKTSYNFGNVYLSKAWAGYSSLLKLEKVDGDTTTHAPIAGARFEITVVDFDPATGEFVEKADAKPLSGTFREELDKDGHAITYFGVQKPLTEIYKIVEVQAPDDFTPDPEPHYYVFEAYLENTTNGLDKIDALKAKINDGKENVHMIVGNGAVSSPNAPEFSNEHAPEPATAELSLTKVLTGGDTNIADYDGKFNFTLKVLETPDNSNYNLEITRHTQSNDEYGIIDFGELTFHEEGTYVLTITEEKGNDPQITYDEKAITITYNVTLDDTVKPYGALKVESKNVTYQYGGEGVSDKPSFTNTVKDMSVTAAVPTITKKLTGRKLTDGEFTFEISADTTNGIELPEAAKNDVNGNVKFDDIKFTKAGTYVVTVSEVVGAETGMEYDKHSLEITYTVKEVGGELKVTDTEYDTSACTFENTYTPQPVPAAPTIKKEYTNGTLKGEDFEFTLEAVSNPDSGMTLPTNTTAKNDDKGNVTFGEITFSKVGTYTVKITETNGGKSYVKYATDPVTIMYTVTDTNNDGVLEVSSDADNQTPVITNEYLTGNLVISKKVEGDTPTNTDQEFTFDVTFKLDGAPLKEAVYYTKNGNTTENFPIEKGEGKITLKAGQTATITGIPVGTEYTVTETDIPANYTPTAASVSGEITANKTKTAAFVNTYTKPEPEVGSLVISKTVQGDGADLTKSFSFSVTFDYPDETSNTEKFSLKNGGSKTFENLPVGTKYTVTETDYTADGYTTTVTDNNASGTISKDGQKITVEFVNTYTKPEPDVGSLKISKTVQGDGADPDKSFSFSVTFDYPDDTGREDNTETFSLKNGGSKTFENLPVGTKYTVTENFSEVHWTTTVTDNNASGTISKDGQEITVEFVNTYTKPEQPKPEVGSLEISKKVTGDTPADLDKAFSFSVTFDYPDDTGREDNTETFSLKNGGSKTFENLPAGTKYTVTETDYTAYGYTSTSTGANGEITANETKTAAFVNTYKKPEQPQPEFGSLVISKTVQGEGADPKQEFTFTVNLYQQDGETPLTDTFNYTGSESGTIKSGETITLKDKESVTIEGLPVGTGYTVTEQKVENYKANQDKFTGTIEKGETAKAAFVNTYTQPTKYDITVSKKVTGSGADKSDEFTFTVTFTDSDKNALGGEFTIILADGTKGTITSGGTFTLKDGESVTIKGIPEGTIYTVEETDSKGYTVSFTDASGVIGEKNAVVQFTNNKEEQVEQSSEPSTEAPPTTQPTQPAQTAPAPTETTTEQTAPAPVETTTEDDRNRVDGDSDSEDRQPNTANTADFGILLLVMAASCVFAAAAKKKAD